MCSTPYWTISDTFNKRNLNIISIIQTGELKFASVDYISPGDLTIFLILSPVRVVIRAITPVTAEYDFPLMLLVKLSAVDRIQPQSNKFAAGVENKATGDSELNEGHQNEGFCVEIATEREGFNINVHVPNNRHQSSLQY